MTRLARYLLSEHLRSRRFVAPLVVLLAVVLTFSGQPPLAAAGTVAAGLFVCQTWIALTFLNTQGTTDRHVFAAVLGDRRFAAGRLLGALVLAGATALVAWLVELVGALLVARVSAAELALVAVGYGIATIAGTALAALFSQPLVRSRAIAVLGLALCLLVTVPLELPPTTTVADAFATGRPGDGAWRLADDVVLVLAFAAVVAIVVVELARRRE